VLDVPTHQDVEGFGAEEFWTVVLLADGMVVGHVHMENLEAKKHMSCAMQGWKRKSFTHGWISSSSSQSSHHTFQTLDVSVSAGR
jgi:hypothetical protein